MQTLQMPDEVAEDFKSSLSDEVKHHIVTENGLTIAQEEEILALDPNDTSGPMAPEEFLKELRNMRNEN